MDETVDRAGFISETVCGDHDTMFRKQIRVFLHFERFAAAFAAIRQRPRWESDPEAIQQLGIVVHCFAPRAQDPCYAYDTARWFYGRAATLTSDGDLRADAFANIGLAYLEERRFDEAAQAYMTSLSNNAAQPYALLGRVAIACNRQDVEDIRRGCRALISRIPTWHKDRNVVMLLSTNPVYGFLRSSRQLFFECFGGSPADLRALHDVQRIEALKDGIDLEHGDVQREIIAPEISTSAETHESCDKLMDMCLWSAIHLPSVPVPTPMFPQRRAGARQ